VPMIFCRYSEGRSDKYFIFDDNGKIGELLQPKDKDNVFNAFRKEGFPSELPLNSFGELRPSPKPSVILVPEQDSIVNYRVWRNLETEDRGNPKENILLGIFESKRSNSNLDPLAKKISDAVTMPTTRISTVDLPILDNGEMVAVPHYRLYIAEANSLAKSTSQSLTEKGVDHQVLEAGISTFDAHRKGFQVLQLPRNSKAESLINEKASRFGGIKPPEEISDIFAALPDLKQVGTVNLSGYSNWNRTQASSRDLRADLQALAAARNINADQLLSDGPGLPTSSRGFVKDLRSRFGSGSTLAALLERDLIPQDKVQQLRVIGGKIDNQYLPIEQVELSSNLSEADHSFLRELQADIKKSTLRSLVNREYAISRHDFGEITKLSQRFPPGETIGGLLNIHGAVSKDLKPLGSEIRHRLGGRVKMVEDIFVIDFRSKEESDRAARVLGLDSTSRVEYQDSEGNSRHAVLLHEDDLMGYLKHIEPKREDFRISGKVDQSKNLMLAAYSDVSDASKLTGARQVQTLKAHVAIGSMNPTSYIGVPLSLEGTKTATERYRQVWGERANTGRYTKSDRIVVIGNQPTGDRSALKAHFDQHYKPLIQAGVDAGATFLIPQESGIAALAKEYLRRTLKLEVLLDEQMGVYTCISPAVEENIIVVPIAQIEEIQEEDFSPSL
jgi:hypothetical protein